VAPLDAPRTLARRARDRAGAAVHSARFAITVYLATRLLLLVVALVNGTLRHHAFTHELSQWDGLWYRMVANHGYPTHVIHVQSTLGFFPLYPLLMWVVSHAFVVPLAHYEILSSTVAGLIVSGIGGLVATVLVQRLAAGWWGEPAGRRAALLYCVFPGSVVFSMVYSEGLLLPLAAGCLLALEQRRWIVAGLCAGFATATEPDSLVLILVCAVAALLELRRQGWSVRRAWRAFLAPLLSLTGVGAFAIFLWRWTGHPTATFTAQHYGWKEKTDPFALIHLATRLGHQLHISHFNVPTINLNNPVGLVGAVILIGGIVLLLRRPGRIPLPALIWTLGIAFLACTSEYVPPNPRLLITAWPAIIVYARYIQGRRFALLIGVMTLLLIELSALTFVGVTLRP
jgi:hypothetical protein